MEEGTRDKNLKAQEEGTRAKNLKAQVYNSECLTIIGHLKFQVLYLAPCTLKS